MRHIGTQNKESIIFTHDSAAPCQAFVQYGNEDQGSPRNQEQGGGLSETLDNFGQHEKWETAFSGTQTVHGKCAQAIQTNFP